MADKEPKLVQTDFISEIPGIEVERNGMAGKATKKVKRVGGEGKKRPF